MIWAYMLGYLAIGFALACGWKRIEPSAESSALGACWLLWLPIGTCVAAFVALMGVVWLAGEFFKLLGRFVR